jgi:DNA-binding transcriptional LysR family regulator
VGKCDGAIRSVADPWMLAKSPCRHQSASKRLARNGDRIVRQTAQRGRANAGRQGFFGRRPTDSRGLYPNYGDWLSTACHRSGFKPRIVKEADGAASALAFVAAGFGVAVVGEPLQKRRTAHRRVGLGEQRSSKMKRCIW